jgi:hypothetical protein
MCDCSQCIGVPFVFAEIDRTIKPCINLNNASDADNLLSVLQLIQANPGFFAIDGCKSALLCASIDELLAWRRDNSLAPTPEAAEIVNLLIPQNVLDQIPVVNNSKC